MTKEVCKIKGNRRGLVITIASGAKLGDVIQHLHKRLSAAENFFVGATACLAFENDPFGSEQIEEIERLIMGYGMNLDSAQPIMNLYPGEASSDDDAEGESEYIDNQQEQTLLVKRTVRSGQKLHYDGNVVVMGDVNPGAEIVCSGDIVVLGSLRGLAHAGVGGKSDAEVFAFRLEPTQLRIGNYISRSPDGKLPQPVKPEVARVVDNMIQIAVYTH